MIKNLKSFYSSSIVNKSIKVLFIRVLGVALFFALTLFLTNFYTPDAVGKYDFTRSVLVLLGGISVLGMNQSILYFSGYLSANNALNSIRPIYHKMLLILLATAVIILIVFLCINKTFINSFFNKDVYNILHKSFLILFFYGITILNIDVYRALNKIYVSELFRNIYRYVPFFIGSIILYSSNNELWLVNVFLMSFVLTGIFSTLNLLYILNKLSNTKLKITIAVTHKDIIKRSVPMAISTIAFILMQSVDIILIGKFLDFKAVAYYSIATKLTMIISLVLASVNAVNSPTIANLYSLEDKKGLKMNLRKASRLIFALTIPAIIILASLSNPILNIFGNAYITAQSALYILLIGQVVNAFCGSVGVYMNMTGKQVMLQYFLVTGFIINLVLNWVLIPKYGILGAAIATSISMIFWNLLGATYLYFKDGIKTFLN